MSGGHWNYDTDTACREVFGWGIYPDYGLASEEMKKNSLLARKIDPLEDKELSELVYDVFCLLHSYDWYVSGDTGEEDYKADVKYFKDKWFKRSADSRVRDEIDKSVAELKEELLTMLL